MNGLVKNKKTLKNKMVFGAKNVINIFAHKNTIL